MAKKKIDFSKQVGGVLSKALSIETDILNPEETLSGIRFGKGSVDGLSPLSESEAAKLAKLEVVIERGLTTFLEVGNALLEIQQEKLYRATHLTIEQYMNDRFSLKRKRGYQLIEAARVINQIAEELETAEPEIQLPDGVDVEQYEAVPTGKVRRSKSTGSTRSQPQDVDYVDEYHASSGEQLKTDGTDTGPFAQSIGKVQRPQNTVRSTRKTIPLPSTESHAATLSQFPDEKRADIWKEAVKTSEQAGAPITAKSIRGAAEKAGVLPSKKSSVNQKAVEETTNPVSDFSENTRKSVNSSGLGSPGTTLDVDGQEAAEKNAETGTTHSDQLPAVALKEKMLLAMPGEIVVTIRGSFLIRQNLVEAWQTSRGNDNPIHDQYKEELTIQEFYELMNLK
ncbi:hypothetical protein [Spirosoma agri]|uniref:DUF3102 domain-containing protein n=1 Tax=Spirosoma agri TaxID=1987381 RepID=A0A6M0IU23_9BACT|nr:hypothetical protein [Spirosoma agri]NEU70823.1 hypothetical protein [Spirosoma agri]